MKYGSLLLLLSLFFASCKKNAPYICETDQLELQGNRRLGVDLVNSTETGDVAADAARLRELGGNFTLAQVDWLALEPSAQAYQDPYDVLSTWDAFLPGADLQLCLSLRPLASGGKLLPPDLANSGFDEPAFIQRWLQLLDYVFTRIDPSLVSFLQIGHEIDGYDSSGEPDFWREYGAFLGATRTHLHSQYPTLKLGFTATLAGLVAHPEIFGPLADSVDVVGVTYFPHNDDFEVPDPSAVWGDLASLVNAYPSSEIFIQELGFPSSRTCDSRENLQAEFYCNYFQAWDLYRDQIPATLMVRMNDLSENAASEMALSYPHNSKRLREFLRTLGLRTFEGKGDNKQAYDMILQQTQARQWQ